MLPDAGEDPVPTAARGWDMPAARHACEAGDPPRPVTDAPWATPATSTPGTSLVPAFPGTSLPSVRAERVIVAVAARTEMLAGAIERLEGRLEEMGERFVDVVTHGDLVEVDSRRARLAAEVSRLSVELKAELDRRLSDLGRAIAAPQGRSATVDHRGPLDLADDRRVAIQANHLEALDKVAHLSDRQSA